MKKMTNLLDKLNKAKQEVVLPVGRKAAIKTALMDHMAQMPVRTSVSFFSFFSSRTFVVPAVVLLVILSGAATASASEVALPGDALYPVKVSVVEKLQGAFLHSDKAQAELALDQLNTRMDEGIELAAHDSLSDEAQIQLDDLMMKHAEQFKSHLDKLSANANEEDAAELNAKYEAILSVHSEALGHFSENSKLNDSLTEQSAAAEEVSTELENKASSGAQPEVAAQNKINAAGNVITEVQNYLAQKAGSSRVSASSNTSAQAKLKSAQDLLAQANSQLTAKNYKEVFNLANESIRAAQEAKASITLNYNLKVDVNSQSRDKGESNQIKGNSSAKGNGNPPSFQQRLKDHWSDSLKLELHD